MNNKILGIITARGGSKRLPRKNVKEFLGKPLLSWTTEVGLSSNVLDRFILTTDDEEIADIGKNCGVEVPFIRPDEYATDTATSYDAVKHAVDWLKENENYEASWVILFEPTSPGRQVFHVKEVANLIQNKPEYDSIIGISEIPGHYSHVKELQRGKDGIVTRVGDGVPLRAIVQRHQDVDASYYINSVVYAFKISNLYDGHDSLWGDSTYGYLVDQKYALDFDTLEELVIAEAKMKLLLA